MKKIYLTLICLFVIVDFGFAQWVQSGATLTTSNSVTIGTGTNPGYRLYIATPNTNPVGIGGNDSTHSGAELNLIRNNSSLAVGRSPGIQFQDLATNRAAIIQAFQGQLQFFNYYTGWVERMRINASGNLLIGKTSQVNSSYLLDVNGSVRANQITVNTTGADFVFGSAYRLPKLSELKFYVSQYHHLPGIEPAKQMQANGLNLGDNQIKLLQKVEELTLYLIRKDDEIKKLKAEMAIQKASNEALDARLKKIEESQNSVRIQKD